MKESSKLSCYFDELGPCPRLLMVESSRYLGKHVDKLKSINRIRCFYAIGAGVYV